MDRLKRVAQNIAFGRLTDELLMQKEELDGHGEYELFAERVCDIVHNYDDALADIERASQQDARSHSDVTSEE